jgi:uroporphyrinogen decarboxylase
VQSIPVNPGLQPEFEERIIEQGPRHTVKTDGRGITCKVFRDETDSMPHFLDFPIKDRETYLPFKERLQPLLEDRIRKDLDDIAEKTRNRNYILAVMAGSTAGYIRDLMGFEGFSIALCMQPELIDEILEDFRTLYCAIARNLTEKLTLDCVVWWEDIAFKTGPITPPEFFHNKCGPVYRSVMDIYRNQGGVRHSWVDCDGDNRLLVPTWRDNGVDIIFPLEVNAGARGTPLFSRQSRLRQCLIHRSNQGLEALPV